jgi:hypothetical protein
VMTNILLTVSSDKWVIGSFCNVTANADSSLSVTCNSTWPGKLLYFVLINLTILTGIRVLFAGFDLIVGSGTAVWNWATLRSRSRWSIPPNQNSWSWSWTS